MKNYALKLLEQGIASLPITSSEKKTPAPGVMWRDYNGKNYNFLTVNDLFSKPHQAFAVMGGYISSGLEILDIDLKNSKDPEALWRDLMDNIEAALPEFRQKCTIVQTPSGGYHIYYSCFQVEGNKKLAQEVHEVNGKSKKMVVIETRGDGGYALTYPSKGYTIIQGSIDSFAYEITPDERDTLHSVCRIFNEEIEDEEYKEVKKYVPRGKNFIQNPFDDYCEKVPFSEIEQLIFEAGFDRPKKHGNRIFYHRTGSENQQGANYHIDKQVFYVWTPNSMLEPERGYNAASLLRDVRCGGDWKEVYKYLIKNGYGQRIQPEDETYINYAYTEIQKGTPKDEIKQAQKKNDVDDKRSEKYIEIAENRIIRMNIFWEETDKGAIKIDPLKLKYFLQNKGFKQFKFSRSDRTSLLVFCDEEAHTIEEIDIAFVKNFLEEYLNDEKMAFPVHIREGVLRELINMTSKFFNNPIFEWLDNVVAGYDIKILDDTTVLSYLFFRNKIVKITASKPQMIDYSDLDDGVYIWKKSIKPHDISLVNMGQSENLNRSEYFKFIKRLCNLKEHTDAMDIKTMAREEENAERLLSFVSAIGYLTHRYKDRKRAWAVIIAEDIEDSNKGGGTGKGIFLRSLEYIRQWVYKPGKSFDPRSQFAFETWEPGTDLFLVDDIDRYFDMKGMYNVITDGGEINMKHKSAFTLTFEQLPKFVFTTNYGDFAMGEAHGERRRKMLLVGNHYGPHFTPFDEFGHNLIDDWDSDQWNLFYNFIFECVSSYLREGFRDFPESENMKIKTFLSTYGIEMFEYLGEVTSENNRLPTLLKSMVDEFHSRYRIKKPFSSQSFSIALQKYCDIFGHRFEKTTGTTRANLNLTMIRFLDSIQIDDEKNDKTLPF